MMKSDDILFSKVKEDRGWYFVEYTPPMLNYRFSVLQLSVIELPDLETVATALEAEAKDWLSRYPVPLMATAFAIDESVLSLVNVRPIDHLMAWVDTSSRNPIIKWELIGDHNLPDIALNREYLKQVFKKFPYETGLDISKEITKQAKANKITWWLFFMWAVVVPLLAAVIEWSSDKLGLLVLVYAFYKAVIEALRLTGKLPKSKRKLQKEVEEAQMRHHHYHCSRNPDAFERLKLENFQKEAIERTLAESKSSKASSPIN
jgi:hypothetical protein